MSPFELLPTELLLMISTYLRFQDINIVAGLSKRLYDVASTPNLWSKCIISKKKIRKKGIDKLLDIKRFQNIITLDLSCMMGFSADQYKKLLNFCLNSKLKSLDLSCVKRDIIDTRGYKQQKQLPCTGKLAEISPVLVGKAINRLESANLSGTYLTTKQAQAIFEEILVSTNLLSLSMGGVKLGQIPTSLFVNALCKVRKVEIFRTTTYDGQNPELVSRDQSKQLLEKLQNKTVLNNLDLEGVYSVFKKWNPNWVCNLDIETIYAKLKKDSYLHRELKNENKRLRLYLASLANIDVHPSKLVVENMEKPQNICRYNGGFSITEYERWLRDRRWHAWLLENI